jgi:hypothetical protein
VAHIGACARQAFPEHALAGALLLQQELLLLQLQLLLQLLPLNLTLELLLQRWLLLLQLLLQLLLHELLLQLLLLLQLQLLQLLLLQLLRLLCGRHADRQCQQGREHKGQFLDHVRASYKDQAPPVRRLAACREAIVTDRPLYATSAVSRRRPDNRS